MRWLLLLVFLALPASGAPDNRETAGAVIGGCMAARYQAPRTWEAALEADRCQTTLITIRTLGNRLDDNLRFCVPLNVSNGQVADIVAGYLSYRPAENDDHIITVVLKALRMAWPCQ